MCLFVGVVVATVAVLAGRIVLHSYLGALSDFERTPPTDIARHPEKAGIAGLREVSLRDADGHILAAWYVPARNRAAVVLVHGTGAERSSLLAETRILAAAGFGALALDLPGQGSSAGETRWADPESHAIGAALDWLAQQSEIDAGRIGGFGLSFGGYVLLQVAAREPRLRGVVLASTPYDLDAETRLANRQWGALSELPALWVLHRYRGRTADLPPPVAIRALAPRAVLVVGGERDRMVPPEASRQLFDAALPPKELWIVAGAGHAGFAETAPQEYAQRLTGFFAQALLQAGAAPSR